VLEIDVVAVVVFPSPEIDKSDDGQCAEAAEPAVDIRAVEEPLVADDSRRGCRGAPDALDQRQ